MERTWRKCPKLEQYRQRYAVLLMNSLLWIENAVTSIVNSLNNKLANCMMCKHAPQADLKETERIPA